MNFNDKEFIKREQSDDLLFEAYEEPIKTKAIKLAKQALEINPVILKFTMKKEILKIALKTKLEQRSQILRMF